MGVKPEPVMSCLPVPIQPLFQEAQWPGLYGVPTLSDYQLGWQMGGLKGRCVLVCRSPAWDQILWWPPPNP